MGSFRSSASNTASASTTCVVTKPAGVADGDLLIACIAKAGSGAITGPVGWESCTSGGNLKNFSQTTASVNGCALWWKKASGEGADFTFTAASTEWVVSVLAFQNINWPILDSGGAPVEIALFDIICIFGRTGSTIVILDEPVWSDLGHDHYFAVAMFAVQETAVTHDLTSPSAYLTQVYTNDLVGISMLAAYAEITLEDAGDSPTIGPTSCTLDASTGTGRGHMILIADPTDEISMKNVRPRSGVAMTEVS